MPFGGCNSPNKVRKIQGGYKMVIYRGIYQAPHTCKPKLVFEMRIIKAQQLPVLLVLKDS